MDARTGSGRRSGLGLYGGRVAGDVESNGGDSCVKIAIFSLLIGVG